MLFCLGEERPGRSANKRGSSSILKKLIRVKLKYETPEV